MRLWLAIILACLPCAVPAQDASDSFYALNKAVLANDAKTSGQYLSQTSQELFGRFASYNLMGCLPKDAAYLSQKGTEKYQIINASITDLSNKKRRVRLVFVPEHSRWKLDLPQTLQLGMGPSWQKRVHNAEQIYLLLKTQMGDKLTCSTIKEFVRS